MPEGTDLSALDDIELANQIAALRRMISEALGEGVAPDPNTAALIRNMGQERDRRRADHLFEATTFAATTVLENSLAASEGYRDYEAHEKNRRALERMAEELGVPLSIPPGTDLSIPEVYEEFITEVFSFSEYLKDLAERQKRGEGSLAGMGTVERIGEALKRALTSGKLSEAVMAELQKLLDPKILKLLPLLLAVGVGLGALGAGGAFIMLAMAYGPIIWDLIKALLAAAEATTAAEFNASVEALIKVFGAIGAEIVTTIGGVLLGKALKGAKRALFPEKPPGTVGRPGRPGRPRKPRGAIHPTWPDGTPRSFPRKRPPWLSPDRARGIHRRRLGLEHPLGRVRGPAASGGAGASAGRKGFGFDNPANKAEFNKINPKTGKKRELIFGDLGPENIDSSSTFLGLIAPDGRIIINRVFKEAMKPFGKSAITDIDEYLRMRRKLIEVLKHEGSHRKLRPYNLPPGERANAAERLRRVYEQSDIVRSLDEIYAYGHDAGSRRFKEFADFWRSISTEFDPDFFFKQMHMGRAEPSIKQLPYLLDDDYFRMIGKDPDAWLRRVRDGSFDFMEYLRALERFIERARKAKPNPLL